MPIQPHADFLATRPVLAEGFYGTLRMETDSFRYWLDGDKVWVEERRDGGWQRVTYYDGREVPR